MIFCNQKSIGLAATYFRRMSPTIMGLEGFHFRVRDGIGWDTFSIATKPMLSLFDNTL